MQQIDNVIVNGTSINKVDIVTNGNRITVFKNDIVEETKEIAIAFIVTKDNYGEGGTRLISFRVWYLPPLYNSFLNDEVYFEVPVSYTIWGFPIFKTRTSRFRVPRFQSNESITIDNVPVPHSPYENENLFQIQIEPREALIVTLPNGENPTTRESGASSEGEVDYIFTDKLITKVPTVRKLYTV